MATYEITTSRSDTGEVRVVTRRRIDAARQVYATIVWDVMLWASLLDRPIAQRLVDKARNATLGDVTEAAPFNISFTRI